MSRPICVPTYLPYLCTIDRPLALCCVVSGYSSVGEAAFTLLTSLTTKFSGNTSADRQM